MSPILSKLYHDGFLDEARAVEQTKVFDAAIRFSRCEGILPAPESSHAIYAAILVLKEIGVLKIRSDVDGPSYYFPVLSGKCACICRRHIRNTVRPKGEFVWNIKMAANGLYRAG